MKNPFWNTKSIFTVLLIPFSIFLLVTSILWMLLSENNEYWLGLILMPFGAIVLWFAMNYMIQTDKAFKRRLVLELDINCPAIEYFTYSKKEWNLFANKNYTRKLNQYRTALIVLTPIITLLLILLYNENVKVFITIGFIVLLLITLISWRVVNSLKELKANTLGQEKPEAKITTSGILLNKNHILSSYHNQDGWLSECTYETFLEMKCLNFKIRRPSGRGHNFQTYHLLIPPKQRE
ncbi:hypothetical protein AAG747_04725 [Rapidithrix thailandica]|uniref:Uncharacterized protein n=1 Tax=Rapidithrix thailandica TaxID=413964 RepID=A0AAW9RQZ8_9BACT